MEQDDLLEKAAQAAYNKQATDKLIAMTKGPVFDKTKDKIGMVMESPCYASKKCKVCYGRGYVVMVTKEISLPTDPPKSYNRFFASCRCQNKGYNKMRRSIEDLMGKGSTFEEAAKRVGYHE